MRRGDEHEIVIDELFKRLLSSPNGLSSEQAITNLKNSGPNILQGKKKLPWILRFLAQFTNFFALLLMGGAILAFIAEKLEPGGGDEYIGAALVFVVILNAIFTFIQEYQSEKIMESFKKMMPDKVEVLRDGVRKSISGKELVPGDVIFLEEGDKIPADARLIAHNSMKVDHSSITGESEPQLRSLACTSKILMESRNMIFSGTLVTTGNGVALVYGTGMNTQIGKIVSLTKDTKETVSPLRKELDHFIKIISSIAISVGVVFFIVSKFIGNPLIGSMIFAIGIIVANVPEGLLPTVTLCLSIASKRMAKKNALIKNLESVETLGSTTVICTDKTGTLTKNKMAVTTVVVAGKLIKASEFKEFHPLQKIMVICNNAHKEGAEFKGDPTETALLEYAQEYIDKIDEPRVREFPFDSTTKRMITVNKTKNGSSAYMKGAPEVVIETCDRIMVAKQKIVPLTKKLKAEVMSQYKELAGTGERVLGFAVNDDADGPKKFIFVGLAGMVDPPRPEVSDSILQCRSAGIRVIMITGDFSLTAEAIARKVGLITDDAGKANVVTGKMLDEMNEVELAKVVKQSNLIFARAIPEHKLRIVKALQAQGEVVTVTGDGVNDAPALKNADMGVAMGVIGTEVAREASDMVLMDDNFATIVSAVEEGRTIFSNIKKFIAYILTSNIPEILPFIAFVLLGIPLPLTVILILSIDLGTDLLPAIGLGTEKPEQDVMKQKPRSRKERLLTGNLLFRSYGIVGMLQAAAGFFAYFWVLYSGGWTWGQQLVFNDPLYRTAVSAFFATIIICQVVNVFICRTRRHSAFKAGSNHMVYLGVVVELLLLGIIIYTPWAHQFFGTASLSLFELSLALPFAILLLSWDELRKYFLRHNNKFFVKFLSW